MGPVNRQWVRPDRIALSRQAIPIHARAATQMAVRNGVLASRPVTIRAVGIHHAIKLVRFYQANLWNAGLVSECSRAPRLVGLADTEPNRKSRKRSKSLEAALTSLRSPCSCKTPRRRSWASFRPPGGRNAGTSESIEVATRPCAYVAWDRGTFQARPELLFERLASGLQYSLAVIESRDPSRGSGAAGLSCGGVSCHGSYRSLMIVRSTRHVIGDECAPLPHGHRLACGRVLGRLQLELSINLGA